MERARRAWAGVSGAILLLLSACGDGPIASNSQDEAQAAAEQRNASLARTATPVAFGSNAPTPQSLEAALNGELFGIPVGPVEAVTCGQESASVFSCDVQFGANDGPTYPEPFRTHLYLVQAGEGWVISE